MSLKLMYITNDPYVAQIAQKYGVDRIWIDLETLGKEERQKGLNTVKSKHCINDIRKIKPLLNTSEMLVRVNPWNPDSKNEIEQVIDAGADIIMLPMWKIPEEVQNFVDTIAGRTKTTLLLETKEADACLDKVLSIKGIDEIHIGLNDLHLSYGLTFMFELLANGTVERICNKIKVAGLPYGFGGIAKLGSGDLPAERIIMEHYRLGSTRAILSRSFCNTDEVKDLSEVEAIFKDNMNNLKKYEKAMADVSEEQYIKNQKVIEKIVQDIIRIKDENH